MNPCRIALVGLMGAGKSQVGRRLAAIVSWPFWDADRLIEARAGRSVPDIFREEGEDAFRHLETIVLAELCAKTPPLVAALGGGIVESSANRDMLRASFEVVWLQVSPAKAALRVGSGQGRPLLEGRVSPRAVLDELHARREPLYREVAKICIQTDTASAGAVARGIAEALARIDRDASSC